jgi:hypothetical protein
MTKFFSETFYRKYISHTIRTEKLAVQQYIKPYRRSNQYLARCYTQPQCCVGNFTGSCRKRLAMSHAAPAGRQEVIAAYGFISGRTALKRSKPRKCREQFVSTI